MADGRLVFSSSDIGTSTFPRHVKERNRRQQAEVQGTEEDEEWAPLPMTMHDDRDMSPLFEPLDRSSPLRSRQEVGSQPRSLVRTTTDFDTAPNNIRRSVFDTTF